MPPTLIAMPGDSNDVGQGFASGADTGFGVPTISDPAVQFNSRYANAVSGPTFIDYPSFRALGNLSIYAAPSAASFGFEITLGSALKARSVPSPVIIKHCVTGSTLAVEWSPTGTYPSSGSGNLFNLFIAQIQAMQTVSGNQLGAVVVSLGTNDAANSGQASAFGANMGTFCAALRAVFGSTLPIIWVKTNPDPLGNPFFATVISQQVAYAATDPLCILVDNADCTLVSDHLHYQPNSYLTIGQRCGAAVATALGYAHPVPSPAPDVVGYGPISLSATNPTVSSFGDEIDGDLQVMSVRAGIVAGTVATPSGWTLVGNASSTASGVTEVHYVFTRAVTAALLAANNGHMPPTTVVVTTATRNAVKVYTVRGPYPNPTIDASAFTPSNVFGAGPVTVPALTTVTDNSLALLLTGGYCGSSGTMTETNGTLAGFVEVQDSAAVIVTDREIEVLARGTLAIHGSTGTFSVSSSASMVQVNAVLAVRPPPAPPPPLLPPTIGSGIAFDPPGAIGLPADDATLLLRFDEETATTPAKDAATNLADMGIATGITLPSVVPAAMGFGRSFSAAALTGLQAKDQAAGTTLLTRDVTVQVILQVDLAALNATGGFGVVVSRGNGASAPEYISYRVDVSAPNLATREGHIRFVWTDTSGVARAQASAAFVWPIGFTMLTATRRWISPTSVLCRYYIGDTLIGSIASSNGDIGGGTTGTTTVGFLGPAVTPTLSFCGVIDELLVLDHEITREEIEATWLRITRYQPYGFQLFTELHDPGFPLPNDSASDARLDIRMTGMALGYAAAQAENMRANMLPQRAYGPVLADWETVVRPTPQPLKDIDTRRSRVLAKIQQRQGSSPPGLAAALSNVIGGAPASALQFLAYDNTIVDPFATVDPLRWDVLPNGGAGVISIISGAAAFQAPVGDLSIGGAPGWVTMRTSVGGDGKQAHALVKLVWTTPISNAEAGIYFQNAGSNNYLLLGLRDVGGSFRIETESFIAGVSQGVVQQAIIGANPAAIWLHLFQTTVDGSWTAAWSTTSATTGFTPSPNITHPTVAHWAGCYVRSVSALGTSPRADFDDFTLRSPFGHRPTNAYVYLDPALGFTPDIDGAHDVIQTVEHAFVHGTLITSKNLLCGAAFGCGRGPMGGGL